jgi:hypothetical protein
MKFALTVFSFSIFLLSCGTGNKHTKDSSYFDFDVQIDTVQVDPCKEILMAGAYIDNPAVSADKKKFYNWDRKNYALEIVDIDNYKLKDKVYFEKEGPEGLNSAHLFSTKSLPNNQFGFEDNYSFKIHDLEGKLFNKVGFDEEWIRQDLEESESFELINANENGTILGGIHFGIDNYKAMMFLLDLEEEKKISISLPKFQKLENYKLVLHRNETYLTSVNPKIYIEFQGDSILISNNHFNDVYTYKSGKLNYTSFKHQLLPEGKEMEYKNRSESREEVVEMSYEMNTEISFTKFLWDDQNNKFYRFANQAFYSEGNDEPTWNLSMMVYDQELNLIGERELMTFDNFAEPLFVKDGKVHFHLNMDDELGFIRIGLKN